MHRFIKRNKGFSLIEVFIAITIFGISLFAILPLIITSMDVTSGTSLRSKAQILAAEKLDELKSLSSVEIESLIGDDIIGGNTSYSSSDSISEGGIILNRDWVIQEANLGWTNAPSYIMSVIVTYTLKDETVTRTVSTLWGH
ncbi:MAG: prepilin-type N-terminal cleavage/methylation domain-containing protein [Thermodesulfobacteriota bacterium]